MDTAKPTQVRIYLDRDKVALAESLATSLGEDKEWLCRKIMAAGLKALQERGAEKVTLPFQFKLELLHR